MIHINGGSGYIGSALIGAFEGATNADLCWFKPGTPVDFVKSEEARRADIIIHLAGHSSEPMCSSDPDGAWVNNVVKFKHLLDWLRPDQLLIYASSASVYASNSDAVTEMDFVSSSRPYDCSKILIDTLAQMHINQGKMIVGLRFGTVAGLAPVQRIDTIVNSMTNSAITHGVVRCIDPSVRRTLLFMPDLIAAIKLIIKNPTPGIYNLGSINTTVGAVGEAVSRSLGVAIDVEDRSANFYDFHLSSAKFEGIYGDFRSAAIADIISELAEGLPYVTKGRRDVAPFD